MPSEIAREYGVKHDKKTDEAVNSIINSIT